MFKSLRYLRNLPRMMDGLFITPTATDHLREGVRINGTYISTRNVRVSGPIEGSLHVAGNVIIETEGAVHGDVFAGKDIRVSGKVHGDLRSSGRIYLARTAVISGSIYTRSLTIEEEALVEGGIRMQNRSAVPFHEPLLTG